MLYIVPMVEAIKDGETIPAKVVYVHNKNKRKNTFENRESQDERSLGELFLYFSDELSDIKWIQAFHLVIQMFRKLLEDDFDLSEEKTSELVDAFMEAIPSTLKSELKVA